MDSKLLIVTLIPIGFVYGALALCSILKHVYRRHKRWHRHPLTCQLLRSPGESLRTEIENLNLDIASCLMMLIFVPVLILAIYLSQICFGGARGDSVTIGTPVVFAILLIGFFLKKSWKLMKDRSKYQLGLDCEIAVGQELNQLMLDGYRVFHDFPAEGFKKNFNIDHIVVGPVGVFSVETKGRSKKTKIGGEEGATVSYDGQRLQFPGWSEHKPVEQARANAKWLSEWLSKAVGDDVIVHPVLVLPGWYVDLKNIGDVFVFNGKNPQFMLRARSYDPLTETLIKQISYKLEQKCRNVEPTAYRQNKKK